MHKALAVFNASIAETRSLAVLYDFLVGHVAAPYPFDDLLRSQIVYSVSAFDKLIHDLIRIGMVDCYRGARKPTPKYLGETITIELHGFLTTTTIPPKEYLFEKEVVQKLSNLSYQEPNKVAEGLSYVWGEPHKWQKIANAMGITETDARTKLKLISVRRNAIVHESDMDPLTNVKRPISKAECTSVTDFLSVCGNSIANLVI